MILHRPPTLLLLTTLALAASTLQANDLATFEDSRQLLGSLNT